LAYHELVAKRKTQGPKKSPAASKKAAAGKKPLGCLFWLAFIIVVSGLFYINRGLIKKTVEDTHLFDRMLNRGPEAESAEASEAENSGVSETAPAAPPEQPAGETRDTESSGTAPGPSPTPGQGGRNPPASAPPAGQTQGWQPAGQDASTGNQNQQSQRPSGQNPALRPPEIAPLRDRTLYFVKIDTDGTILRTAVPRKLPASDSPLLDALGALLLGPSAEEQRRGLITLLPSGTAILSATVRGSTAYISFNEDFQFNTNGADGYTAQLRQVVWTATEFSNVKDVQILIEGRRVDYLGESIWIGSPVSRDMF
jgi:spore germination protein GerM